MTIENIGLFQAMSAKMNYLAERQKVISQNVANADTPGYTSQDLNKVDFGRMVDKITQDHKSISLATSEAGHMLPPNQAIPAKEGKNKTPYEVAPDGNAVVLEEQMIRASQNQMDYSLMINLYRNNVDMMRTALGRQQ
ncbi:MAG TPA: flagellar basal body rod protein FlgB [Alphaproteobacteria bacterium]|nr:flagellar basal body rod protein FlgB [Alphaproteobacteria bacterium]HNS45187.1 flagellar basal body rod protein FlgB [Alphaproteobacteria bacterium]